eukprot:c7108_g1_i1 orf=569-925(-)
MAAAGAVGGVGAYISMNVSSVRKTGKVGMRRLIPFVGLKPENKVAVSGSIESSDRQFARLVTECRARRGGSKGGAVNSYCDIGSEIFRVVPIMCGLTLIGIAVGFVLLRVEAAMEESE